ALEIFQKVEEEITVPENIKDYSIFLHEDSVYECFNGQGKLLRDQKGKELSTKDVEKAKSFIVLKNLLNKLLSLQLSEYASDDEVEATRRVFSQEHDLHVKKFGYISQKLTHKHLVDDSDYIKLAATENVNEKIKTLPSGKKSLTKEYSKGDIFFQRTQFPWKEPTSAKNIIEAGLISHAYRHAVNLEYVKNLMDINSEAEAKRLLLDSGDFFENPTTKLIELKSKYLSGNVARKLDVAQKIACDNPKYKSNVAALINVQPKPLHIEEIDFKLGSYWLPAETIENWIKDQLSAKCEVKYIPSADKWEINPNFNDRYEITDYKVNSMDVFDIILLTLNLKDPIVRDKIIDRDGKEKYIINQEETLAARHIQQTMIDSYKAFVMNDDVSGQAIEKIYNELFNNHVDREHQLPPFDVYPNASEFINGERFVFREHQKKGVTRCIESNTLLAHCVGSGKTAVMITAGMELKRLQLATKSLIVVQNATLEQFAAFAPKLYPNARILVAEKKDLVKAKRKRFLSRIATCNWDIIIMAQSSFDMIKNDPKVEEKHFQDQIDDLDSIINDLHNKGSRYGIKDAVRAQKQLKVRLAKLLERTNEEDILYFHELGIDALFIDEAHAYKKNFFVTKKERVKGLDTSSSQKSFSLSIKIKTICGKTNGRNIYLATGTPVTNTLAELWNMVRYISPEILADYHITTFDRFASTFTETETALEIDAAGRFKMITRFAKYTNVTEMSKMFRSVADVILSEDLKDVKRPPIKGGATQNINIPRSSNISKYMEYLSALYRWYENLPDKREYSHIPLIIYGQSRKATIDMRLIDSRLADDPDSKLNTCVNKLFDKYREYDFQKGTQVVFSDLYGVLGIN
ncbi:MAG: DEAD/DEAH box helicase family protein, partial [Victivallales bacterium]|nr:DEAD/DEAH box helicase family protein [Victivallales bacterium]